MASETTPAAESGEASVVLARFDSYRHAEHMLASLGHGFRAKARKGGATAVVVRGNPDGSLKVTESRVLSASDFVSTVLRVSLSWTIGFMGLFSTLKGAKEEARAAHVRKGHAGSDEHRAHEILAGAGPHAALVLVRCQDQQTRQVVAAAAADSAEDSWDGSLTDFLAALDPGSAHDWVRAAIGEPSRRTARRMASCGKGSLTPAPAGCLGLVDVPEGSLQRPFRYIHGLRARTCRMGMRPCGHA
jgi:hypothetical protein